MGNLFNFFTMYHRRTRRKEDQIAGNCRGRHIVGFPESLIEVVGGLRIKLKT